MVCRSDVAGSDREDALQEDDGDVPHHGGVPQVQAADVHLEAGGAVQVSQYAPPRTAAHRHALYIWRLVELFK